MNLKALYTDDKAVSPVIGVILMVAITVILAAVIGTFVLGLGDQVGDTTPNNQLSLDADPAFVDSAASRFATIDHQTGNSVQSADLRIIIRNSDGDPIARFTELGSGTDSATIDTADDVTAEISGDTDVFETGDRISLSTDAATVTDLNEGDEIQVTVIHSPSDGNMMDRSITLATNTA